jgi:hypothetical protein
MIEKIQIGEHFVWIDKKSKKIGYVFDVAKNASPLFRNLITDEEIKEAQETEFKIVAASSELNLEDIPTYIQYLADNYAIDKQNESNKYYISLESFIAGHKTAEKELPTWDDVKKAIELARKTDLSNHVNSKGADYDFSFDWAKTQQEIIAELQNKK